LRQRFVSFGQISQFVAGRIFLDKCCAAICALMSTQLRFTRQLAAKIACAASSISDPPFFEVAHAAAALPARALFGGRP
jgi:hypothetical protein